MIAALCFLNSSEAARDVSQKKGASSGDFRVGKKRSSPDASSKALAHYAMGIIYDNEGRSGEAVREYTAAAALKPLDQATAQYNLARAYLASGNRTKAQEYVLASLEAAPGFRPAQKLLLELEDSPKGQ